MAVFVIAIVVAFVAFLWSRSKERTTPTVLSDISRTEPSEKPLHTEQKQLTVSVPGTNQSRPGRKRQLLPNTFIVIDLETTGLSVSSNEIIEIAAIKVTLDKNEHPVFQTLVKPIRKIPKKITALTGITEAMIEAEGVSISTAMRQLIEFIGDAPIVTYHAAFDMPFLWKAADSCGLSITNRYTCALKRARRAFPGLESYRLSALILELALPTSTAHRALNDCECALRVFWMATVELKTAVRWKNRVAAVLS